MNKIAIDVISLELQGLSSLLSAIEDPNQNSLGYNFAQAVSLMQTLKGRVIVTGMGKSGHIGRKISATLASTGTLSNYVHPAEANHGDLGMISKDDLIIAISNSGATAELSGVIGYANRYDIPLIGITSKQGSILDKASTISLLLPDSVEACGVTNAPTTSTLLTLALGDALAVTLMKLRGFTSDDFHNFHPGGKLGASLKKISSIMLPLNADHTCTTKTSLTDAIERINNTKLGCIGVLTDEGSLAGVITDGDLRRNYNTAEKALGVEDVMTKNPICISPNDLAAKGLKIMSEKKVTSLFVVDENNAAVGIIHIHDFLTRGVM